jgi:hypothetical protein
VAVRLSHLRYPPVAADIGRWKSASAVVRVSVMLVSFRVRGPRRGGGHDGVVGRGHLHRPLPLSADANSGSEGLWRPQFLSPTWLNNFPFPSSAPLTLSLRVARPRRGGFSDPRSSLLSFVSRPGPREATLWHASLLAISQIIGGYF